MEADRHEPTLGKQCRKEVREERSNYSTNEKRKKMWMFEIATPMEQRGWVTDRNELKEIFVRFLGLRGREKGI